MPSQSLEEVIELRNWVHLNIPAPKEGDENLRKPTWESFEEEIAAAQAGQTVHMCQGRSLIFQYLLTQKGYENRYIFTAEEPHAHHFRVNFTHASADVRINGKWYAMDAHCNASLEYQGRKLSWKEARELMLAGEKVDMPTDGKTNTLCFDLGTFAQRTKGGFPTLLRHMYLSSSTNEDCEVLGPWYGVMTYINDSGPYGTYFDVVAGHESPGSTWRRLSGSASRFDQEIVLRQKIDKVNQLREWFTDRIPTRTGPELRRPRWLDFEVELSMSLNGSNQLNEEDRCILFVHVLKRNGFPSRLVKLVAQDESGIAMAHTAVEANLDGQWYAMDVLNNCGFGYYRYAPLGWKKVWEAVREGNPAPIQPDDQRTNPALANYQKILTGMPWNLFIASSNTPAEIHGDWDGKVRLPGPDGEMTEMDFMAEYDHPQAPARRVGR